MKIEVDLGDDAHARLYPPPLPADLVDDVRHWIGANMTIACAVGDHERSDGGCGGVCALGSTIVTPRPCLCVCHAPVRMPG